MTHYSSGVSINDEGNVIELALNIKIGNVTLPNLIDLPDLQAQKQIIKADHTRAIGCSTPVPEPFYHQSFISTECFKSIPTHVLYTQFIIHISTAHGRMILTYLIDNGQ
jgi:hypothetical protein